MKHSPAIAGLLARGRTDTNFNGGNYNGTVSVSVEVPDAVAADVNRWLCQIYLFAFNTANGCTPALDAADRHCAARPGSVLVSQVEGTLPARAGR